MTTGVKKKIKSDGSLTYRMIDTRADLETFVHDLSPAKRIAVDLEADSMHHYKEKVCVIQIADNTHCMVIDSLRIGDLSLLKPVFSNPKIQKIFHGSDYDVRSLYRDFQISISNLFDTELACRFLGFRESGLESVLHRRFKVQLDKKFQRRDWSVRPLPEEMIKYAAADVYYLIPLAKMLQKELNEKKRCTWVDEECIHLTRVRPSSSNTGPYYLKFKGAGRLSPRSLAVLDSLLELRDKIAAKKDRPHYKIFGNESLKRIAAMECPDLKQLADADILSRKQIGMYGEDIRAAVEKALSLPENRLPAYPHKPSALVPATVRKRIKTLRRWRDQKADEMDLDPSILLTRAQIAAVAQINPQNRQAMAQIPEVKNWQRKAFGGEIVHLLQKAHGEGSR